MDDFEMKGAIVLNSSIEFAITGPLGGRDRVLAKSMNASLDLVGLAALGREKRSADQSNLTGLLLQSEPTNVVSSFPLHDIEPSSDSRRSSFSFAWRGYTTQSSRERIKDTFNLQLADLHRALKARDSSEIEWALGPVIYQCVAANERRIARKRLLQWILIGYAAMFVVAGAVALVSEVPRILSTFSH